MPRDHLSFQLSEAFIEGYAGREVEWGFPIGGGNTLGEINFIDKYSLVKDDGTKERWFETCRRTVEGTYSILKNWCLANRTPWYHPKAQRAAEEMYDRQFRFLWTPPGRGLFKMGTPFVFEEGSASLQNCGFISTESLGPRQPTLVFCRMMEMSMLGVGVGFDVRGAGNLTINKPQGQVSVFRVPDSREGWCESVDHLLRSFFVPNQRPVAFDYSLIRPAGTPLKRFGGFSGGPGPLCELHERISALLTPLVGTRITVRVITDLMNVIGCCVVAGNLRRSSQIALGDPDDKEFLDLKNIEVNPERMGVTRGPDGEIIWGDGWGRLSNNSVMRTRPGINLDHLPDRIAANGEPGIYDLYLAQLYGRMVDGPQWSPQGMGEDRMPLEYRVKGGNPCIAGETMVQTTAGPRRADSLLGEPFWAVVNGRAYHSRTGMYVTRTADLHRLSTKEGYSALVTTNHEIRTADGRMVAAKDLVPGDKVKINNHREVGGWEGRGTSGEGYLLGLFVGDGGWESVPVVKVWSKDVGSGGIRDHATWAANDLPKRRSDWRAWRDHRRGYEVMSLPTAWMRSWGFNHGSKITDRLEETSSAFHIGFLRGFFDSDGSVEGWQGDHGKGASVRVGQVDRPRLEMVQRMLLRLGIKARIYDGHPERDQALPGGTYHCQRSWRLVISSSDVGVFADRIGFAHDIKAERLAKVMARTSFYAKPFVATVESLEYVRTDTVYDCTVEDVHLFDANGFVVSNCMEQPLEPWELCTLSETYPIKHDNLEDYLRTLKHAYLYAKAVTLMPTHWPESNEVMQRNRRIGLSMSGVAQFVETRGVAELRRWCDTGYHEVCRRDRQYSEWLGVRESIKHTSVKPSGTVSLLAGVTPGVHWPPGGGTGNTYIRRIRLGKANPLVEACREAGYHIEPDVQDPDFSVIVAFPTRGPDVRPEREVSVWEKAHLAAILQEWWADNMVSATLTFRPDEEDQVGPVIRMLDGALKTMSFLPLGEEATTGAYPQMPYEGLVEDELERAWKKIKAFDVDKLYVNSFEPAGESGCSNDVCDVPSPTATVRLSDESSLPSEPLAVR